MLCSKSTEKTKLKVYSDGGSRGNPGDSAIAFIILSEDEKVLKRFSKYLGIRTNNQAEYEALISALESASNLTSQEVVCYMDSELVVKHLNGEWQVRNPNLRILWRRVRELTHNFSRTTFKHVPRTNKHVIIVDKLINQTLNRMSNRIWDFLSQSASLEAKY